MRLREINKKEFENFCKQSNQNNFFQSKYYAQIKRREGYHTYFVGLDQNGILRGAAMLLSKNISILKKRIFYAPRGFIIDYKNQELLNIFTTYIREYVKNKHGVFIRINPYLVLHDRKFDGELIQGGLDNSKAVINLHNIGWGQKVEEEREFWDEPSLLYQVELKGKNEYELFECFDSSLQDIIKRNEAIGISTEKLSISDYPKFLDIMHNSSNISNYLNVDNKNFKDIINILKVDNMIEITIAELDIDKYLESTINSKNNITNDKELEEKINKQIESIKTLQYKYGHKILLGGVLSVLYDDEYLNLVTATIDKFNNFNPLLTLYWETMKSAKKNGKNIYNFYGIGNVLENNIKLEEFKKFNGKVVELIGEFDLVINKFWHMRQIKKEVNKHRY